MRPALTPELGRSFVAIVLGHVEREYPNKLDHVLGADADARTPRDLHPIFHGSFDWHSCVHGYWTLATLRRLFPAEVGAEVAALFDRQLIPGKVAAELAYLERQFAGGFERPYGWAWLLVLQAELERQDEPKWAGALRPLARAFAGRLATYLPKLTYPIRAGTHANTAFALRLAQDYAKACGEAELLGLIASRAWDWFGKDEDCQAWEPSGDDFLSSALMEAECLRGLLPPDAFARWFDQFLPGIAEGRPKSLFEPAVVSNPSDGKIAHLDGTNLSRAWCWRWLASALPADDRRRAPMLAVADRHLNASLPAVSGHYMGEHWLASFALLALLAPD